MLGANFLVCPSACCGALAFPYPTYPSQHMHRQPWARSSRYMENSRWRYPHADWEAALATARSQLAGARPIGFHAINCHATMCNLMAYEVPRASELPSGAPLQRR